jgi:hypothetical protein
VKDVQQFWEMTPVLFVKKKSCMEYTEELTGGGPAGLFPTPNAEVLHREVLAVNILIAWSVISIIW